MDRLTLLADNRRVEDLLLEVEKLPPGKDRISGIWRLMKEWLPLDRSAAMGWMEQLADSQEKDNAVRGMLESWCKEDSHAASAYVAALPEGPSKRSAGKALSHTLMSRDPAAGLSWSLASREADDKVEDDIGYKVTALAYGDYPNAVQLVNDSSLSPEEKQQMQETARKAWNRQKVQNGEWDQVIPGKGGPP